MRRVGSGWTVLFSGLALLAASPAWADIEISQKADRTELGIEDTFLLSVMVVDAPPSAQVQFPAPQDFKVLSRSRSNQRSVELSADGRAVIREVTLYTLRLRATTRTGKLTIPPAVLITAGRTYKAKPIKMTVKPGRLEPAPQAVDAPQEGDEPVIPQGDSSVFLWASLDRDQVYAGEQTTLSLYLYSRVELSSVDTITLPKLEDFWGEDLERPTELSGKERIINGVPYRAYLLRRQALFPMKAGTLTLPPAEADITTGTLFAGKRAQRASNGLEVKVEPLPPGEPPGFASANVGSWKLSVGVSSKRVELGLPVTVVVMLEGAGNVTNVTPPKLMVPEGLKVYEPITWHQLSPHPKELRGRRIQEYVVIPLRAGTFTLPAMEVSYFDLRRREYDVAHTNPLTLTVEGGGGMKGAAPASSSELQEACDGGDARSCNLLGELYEEGRGVPKNLRRAATLFGRACAGGSAPACYSLGLDYREGQGVPWNNLYSAVLSREACEGGELGGCNNLGLHYLEGRGVPKDERRAATLFEKTCEGGEADGCHNLAIFEKSCSAGDSTDCAPQSR